MAQNPVPEIMKKGRASAPKGKKPNSVMGALYYSGYSAEAARPVFDQIADFEFEQPHFEKPVTEVQNLKSLDAGPKKINTALLAKQLAAAKARRSAELLAIYQGHLKSMQLLKNNAVKKPK